MGVIARIKERQAVLKLATRRVLLTRVAKCTDVAGGIFEMYYTVPTLSLER
jgi:hypothetical protein